MPIMLKLICLIAFLVINQVTLNVAKKVSVVELTNSWTLTNSNGTVKVRGLKLPSGVFTALKSRYGDILNSKNDVDLRWIANETWTYSRTFDDLEEIKTNMANLTFHGIDTIANVRLNGKPLGHTHNMFVRYSFDVTTLLQPTDNLLEVELMSPLQASRQHAEELWAKNMTAPPECPNSRGDVECYRNMLRKMQMSFGGELNLAAPSMGIWKIVTLEYYEVAIVREIDVATRQNDTHWTMDIRAFLSTGIHSNFYSRLQLYAAELIDEPFIVETTEISYASPILDFKVHIKNNRVQKWWPNGYGDQKLYPIFISVDTWLSKDGPHIDLRTTSQKTLKIGFRTIELVENEDARGRTFYFKVNDHPIFMKGANFMPTHILPELSADSTKLNNLFKTAKDMHMNMLRVWGGGLYESDLFYTLADYYGLLIWQDMTFTAATYPVTELFLESIRRETVQNAMRLSYHPSLALIVTNNDIELYLVKNRSDFESEANRLEDEYTLLFLGTIRHELNVISRNDFKPRPGPMMSTPSLGIEEATKELPADPQNVNYGDVHIAINEKNGFDPEIYPRGRFITEVGYASLPILSSWQRTLDSEDVLTDIITHRQHDPNGLLPIFRLIAYELPFKPASWEENIEELIYFSQLAQAMTAKTAIDLFRSLRYNENTMGALIWQLNDVWVAPSWSCIDFYDNYKLVYYWAREFMAPTHVIALYDAKNDMINVTITREDYSEKSNPKDYTVSVDVYKWDDLFPLPGYSNIYNEKLDANGITQFCIDSNAFPNGADKSKVFLKFILTEDKEVVASTFYWPVPIKQIVGIRDPELQISLVTVDKDNCDSTINTSSINIRITVKYPALFVYLELNYPKTTIEKYKFSENGFTQIEPVKMIQLEVSPCISNLQTEHIKISVMNHYLYTS